ncbi:MAG: patatin-like phospholipase family protein [Bacteroidota bacterium]
MIQSWCRGFAVAVALCACVPSSLFTQSNIIITPRLDESPSSQRGFYPHKPLKRPRIGLVLSGGGARGVAQIGVLRALERHGIPVDLISATSLGAVVGGLYASGYTTDELEHLVRTTDWDDVLSLSDPTRRKDLFVDQKIADDRSFMAIRFEGLEPVIPSAVSSGQRLTDFLSTQTLQSLYHPYPSFDDLKISFRAIATDLISGRRILMKEGSLAEALRASATVPLLFSPIERDSMQLIDGGLISNIPVDVAHAESCDIIIAVNSTSSLRNRVELTAPWQTADQIMGIMMQTANEQQLSLADIIITPQIGKHLSSDFTGLDSLIQIGDRAAEAAMAEIKTLYKRKFNEMVDREVAASESLFISASASDTLSVQHVRAEVRGAGIPDSLWQAIVSRSASGEFSLAEVYRDLCALYELGTFNDVSAELVQDSSAWRIVYNVDQNAMFARVEIEGWKLIEESVLKEKFAELMFTPLRPEGVNAALEETMRLYRVLGYSLARIESTSFDPITGRLLVRINEGVIDRIVVAGAARTQDYSVLREFPLEEGDVFRIEKARTGLVNINSSTLFEYVYLEVAYPEEHPVLTIRLKERPSQLVRLGVRADNERNLQGSVDIRDENFRGTGSQLGLTLAGGSRNREYTLEYKTIRLFDTYLTFNVGAFFSLHDAFVYDDVSLMSQTRWERRRVGEYRDIRVGGRLIFGSQLERLGNATVELNVQRARIKNLENFESLEDQYLLSMFRVGTIIDTKDAYPFPTSGIGLKLSYEIASRFLGSDVGYNALHVMYESYSSLGGRHTLHPKLTLGVGDRTMPLGQQFRLGGRESFFGVNEDDRRGRQLLVINLEYRYLVPFRILFETYVRFRYDLGSISSVPEEIKFNQFRHGLGLELALDTPVGPALFGVGKGFQFVRDLPDNPIQQGPFLLYFHIGYQL